MTTLQRATRTFFDQGAHAIVKIKWLLIAIMGVGLGVWIGHLLGSPYAIRSAVTSLVFVAVILVTIHKPLNGILIWLILQPFIETRLKVSMGVGLPDLSFSRLTIVSLIIVMLARAATGRFQFRRIDTADICIILTTVGILISAPLSNNPLGVVQTAISWYFTPFAIYFFAKNLVRNKEDLHRLLQAIVIFGFMAALYAIYEQATGNIYFISEGKAVDELKTDYSESLWMIRGLLGRPGNFGRVFISTIPITFYLILESKRIAPKFVLLGALGIQACGIYLTYNRTAWFALAISLFILYFFHPQFRKIFLFIAFLTAAALLANWSQIRESIVVEERVLSKVSTLEGRKARWEAGYNMWQEKPVRGWGPRRHREELFRFGSDGKKKNIGAIENEYLYILVGSGLIGFLPYFLFLLAPLVNSLRLYYRARAPDWSGFITPEIISIYWCVMLSFAIGSFTQTQTQPIVKMIPFALAGAVVGSHTALLHRLK